MLAGFQEPTRVRAYLLPAREYPRSHATLQTVLSFDPEPGLPTSASAIVTEALGAVYTKPWIVELILDLAGYRQDVDLAAAVATEPAAGAGAFLLPMATRLVQSCRLHGHPVTDAADSLLAYELNGDR